jgi:hypothetical protein
MGILDRLFGSKKRPLGDLPKQRDALSDEAEAMATLMAALGGMANGGVDADIIPGGVGEFGLSVDNPVPCHTILGSHAYLASLRHKGEPITYVRIGSFGSKVVESPVDKYTVSNQSGSHLADVFISAYQKRNSSIAPKGFSIEK